MQSAESETRCPVCGENGVRACIDESGDLLAFDHEGRPAFFPPGFDRILPPAKP